MASKSNKGECVKVVVRVRPLNSVERERGDEVIVAVDEKRGTVACKKVAPDSAENKDFTFDYVFGSQSTQKDVFEKTARPIVDSCLGGYNGTIFAYGQTGTGKTFTMEGVMDDDNLRGIMPNSFYYIMSAVAAAPTNMQYLVRVSFIEIYLDDVFDLLSTKGRIKMEVKENKEKGVFVKDVSAYVVKSVPDMLKVLKVGQKNRKVGATKMNEGSSRSHSIFTITIETSETDAQGENHYKVGKLNMVDLAGSERQKKTEATGDRLDEAKAINLSLSALGNVIKALINPNAKHIPFRDSKLTRLLQDSLGGNTKTMMVANLGPSVHNFDETMSTLRYADRAKQIKNIPRINEDPKDAMLREYQEEIAKLKAQLEARKGGSSGVPRMVAQTQPDGTVIEVPVYDGQPEVEENIIEKEVVQHTGVTEDDLIAARKKVEQEHAEFQSLSEAERKKLVDAQAEVSRKAAQMEEQLKRKHQQLEKEKAEWEAFQKKIAEKEALLLHGSGKLDEAQKQKKELERVEEELRLRRQQETKLKQDLAEAEDAELYMNEHYANSQEELSKKTKHLKALWARYQEKKADLEALTEEFSLERNDLVDTIRALDRQIKLKNMMMDAFIPAPYVELIETRAHWDSINDEWAIPGLEFAGNNIERGGGYRRRAAMNTYNPAMLGHGRSFDPTNQSGQAGNKEKTQANAEDAHPHEVYKSYGGTAPSKKSRSSTDENSGDTANHDGERKRSGSVSKKKKKRESVQ